MAKVSIVIPMYNSSGTIERALLSVISQSFTDYEVFVVDDGSTDNCAELVEAFVLSNGLSDSWRVITQPNGGPSIARNHGMRLAKSDYIAFLDADDEWLSKKLEIQVEAMDGNPNLGLVGTYRAHSEDKMELKVVGFKAMLWSNPYSTPTVMLRRSFVEISKLTFNSQQRYSEDYRFWLEIAARYECAIITKQLVLLDGGEQNTENHKGLSSQKWQMEKGELSNYSYLLGRGQISFFRYLACSAFSFVKYLRRVIV